MRKMLLFMVTAATILLISGCIQLPSEVESIKVNNWPSDEFMVGGDPIDISGVTVTVTYSDGSEQDLSIADVTLRSNGLVPGEDLALSLEEVGEYYVRISYGGVSVTLHYTIAPLFAGGEGTELSPYLIESAEQLSNIRTDMDAHYRLISDIDIDIDTWESIGSESGGIGANGFHGVLDGTNLSGQEDDRYTIRFHMDNGISESYSGFRGLFAALGMRPTEGKEGPARSVTVSNLNLFFDNIDTPDHVFAGLAATSTPWGPGLPAPHAKHYLTNIETSGNLNIDYGTPMILEGDEGAHYIDHFQNTSNMQVGGGRNAFLIADPRTWNNMYIITNSSNSGSITQRASDEAPELLAGIFVANPGDRASFMFDDVSNTGTITHVNPPAEPDEYHIFLNTWSTAIATRTIVVRNETECDILQGSGTCDLDTDLTTEDVLDGDTVVGVKVTGQTIQSPETDLVIPDTIDDKPVLAIGASAFQDNLKLVSISLPATVTTIENNAFQRAHLLEEVVFRGESQLESIGALAFHEARSLKVIDLPSNLTTIGHRGFFSTVSLKEIHIPASVELIDTDAFMLARALVSVSFEEGGSEGLTINASAFKNNYSLETIVFPSRLVAVKGDVFNGTLVLYSIVIPSNVYWMAANAFLNVSGNMIIFIDMTEFPPEYRNGSEPGWNSNWNPDGIPYYFNDEWSYDNGVPTLN